MTPGADAVPGGVLTLAEDLRVASANRSMAELVNRPAADLIGLPFDELLSVPSRILFQTHVYPALKADGRVSEVFLTLAGDAGGTAIPVLLNAMKATDGEETTYEALVVQILARACWEADLLSATRALADERAATRRIAEELAATAADLAQRHAEEQRNREFRDAFIGVISHELRTPITTIYGMSHLLNRKLESMDDEVVRQHLHDIESEADRLRRLTEDLLVLSRSEGHGLQVAHDPIVLRHLIGKAVEGERRRSSRHTIEVEVPPGLPLVLGEDLHVEQVIRNYLSNAAKYSPAGTTIRVVAGVDTGGVAVRVIDSGPGFGDQPPDQLFELFYRAPAATKLASGAGIGLFVCRQLIEAMGGRVWASAASEPATTGAEFGFWLPTMDEGAGI